MRRAAIIALVASALAVTPTAAAAQDSLAGPTKRLTTAFHEVVAAVKARGALLARLNQFRAAIKRVRQQPAGPARVYRLRRLLSEARQLSTKLSTADRAVAGATTQLVQARATLMSLVAMMGNRGSLSRRVRAIVARTEAISRRPRLVLRLARAKLHPLDSPKTILEKADLIRDSVDKLLRRVTAVDKLIGKLEERRKLRRIAGRVDEYDSLFGEGIARRTVVRNHPGTTTTTTTRTPETDDGARNAQNPPPGGTAETPQGAFTLNDADGVDPAATPTVTTTVTTSPVTLRQLLTPTTIAELRRARNSSDPAVRLQALRRARAELAKAAARLRHKANAYRQRAATLRRQEHRRHR